MANTLTYQEAIEEAAKMRSQKVTWPDIADYLKKQGYRSPRTKRPLSPVGVRNMVLTYQEKIDQEEQAQNTYYQYTGTPAADKLNAIKKLLHIKEVPDREKLEMIEAYLG